MRARVLVRPKAGILDPQGIAVERALPALGFHGVEHVHVGRLIELDVEDPALLPNVGLRFVCRQVGVVVERADTPFTRACTPGEVLSIPVKHTTGRYFAPDLDELEAAGQVVLRYAHDGNPNGSSNDVAGVCNASRNVVGLMPHPEHAVDPLLGSADGLELFASATREPANA